MKIAHFTDTYRPQVGGVPSAIIALNNALVRRGHKVTVFSPEKENRVVHRKNLTEIYYKGFERPNYKGLYFGIPDLVETGKVFEKERFDLVHTHENYLVGLGALEMSRKYELPLVATCHGLISKYLEAWSKHLLMGDLLYRLLNAPQNRYSYEFYNRCDAVTTPSRYMKRFLGRQGLKNVHVVPNGINLKKFHPSKAVKQFRKKYCLGDEKFILYLGRIAPEKNIGFLLKNASKFDAKLVICGSGPATETTKQYVCKHALDKQVKILGFLPDGELSTCYSAANVFVTPSLSETQGLTVIEAMACGTPTVVFNVATAEAVIHRRTGFIARTDKQFIDYTNKIVNDAGMRSRMGERALEASKKHSEDRFGEEMLNVYRKLVG